MGVRKVISDYVGSLLKAEICNCCPMCGVFEKTGNNFTNHHINNDSCVSEYWNLIRICKECHDEINKGQDGVRDKKIRQIKKDLFRRLIGSASLEVLLLADSQLDGVTSTLPCLAIPLLKLDLISVEQENSIHVGVATHPTIGDYKIRERGKELVRELNLK